MAVPQVQSFKLVGPNLYRADSGTYYVLVKRGGKQFRRSLKTKDSALAKRRLWEFMDKNRWKFWVFPSEKKDVAKQGIVNLTGSPQMDPRYPAHTVAKTKSASVTIAKKLTPELLTELENGGNVLLLEEDAQLSAPLRPAIMAHNVAPVANASLALQESKFRCCSGRGGFGPI